MTHILQKLRDDVAGMQQPLNDHAKGGGAVLAHAYNMALDYVASLIEALLADQPEPDELVARLRSSRSVWTREGSIPNELETAAADLITSQQAENTAMREAGQAVVDRWDSPDWSDHRHTADFINDLRAALSRKDTA